jgi:CarD family transcriptional regulator
MDSRDIIKQALKLFTQWRQSCQDWLFVKSLDLAVVEPVRDTSKILFVSIPRKKQKMNYRPGDKVIHSKYGLGEIVQFDEKIIQGRSTSCYVIRARDMTIWVPVEKISALRLRLPLTKTEFKELFSILKSKSEPLSEDRYERKMQLLGRMECGNLASICKVVRDLSAYRKIKKMNDNDKFTFEQARDSLLEEWMYVFAISLSRARQELDLLMQS